MSTKDDFARKTVTRFLSEHSFGMWGMWQWELQADNLFCSDVFFDPLDTPEVAGTHCLLHPEDIIIVKEIIGRAKTKIREDFSFRVITAYGVVTTLKGSGFFEILEEE